jgi:outer membrane immunogenic protein
MRTATIVAAVATALAVTTSANATVLGPPPPGFSWTGPYLGGHVGHADVDFDGIFDSSQLNNNPDYLVRGSRIDVEGWFGGLQFGYNMQWGIWVLGVEGDIGFLDQSDKVFDPDPGVNVPADQTDYVHANVDTLGTLRVRGGPTFGRFFVFGTVGAAWTKVKWTVCDCEANNQARSKDTLNFDASGLAYGGGIEVALGDRWSIKSEGLILDFDDRKSTARLNAESDPHDFAELEQIVVWRVGVNYRFGSPHQASAVRQPAKTP